MGRKCAEEGVEAVGASLRRLTSSKYGLIPNVPLYVLEPLEARLRVSYSSIFVKWSPGG
jgi:hypothetical protein